MKSVSLFLACLLFSMSSVYGGLLEDLLNEISAAKAPAMKAFKDDAQQLPASLMVELDSRDGSKASEALIIYWLYGGESAAHAELIWWRSKSPLLRSLAAALLLTGKEENVANAPFLDASRFSEVERRLRAEELALVERNGRRLGAALKAIVEETFTLNPNDWKEALKQRFSGF